LRKRAAVGITMVQILGTLMTIFGVVVFVWTLCSAASILSRIDERGRPKENDDRRPKTISAKRIY
jgi:hypothetical protein